MSTVFVLLFSLAAQAQDPGSATTWCGLSYRHDSYGRGLEAGFRGKGAPAPDLHDVGCYRLGVREGRRLRATCPVADFDRAFAEGLSAVLIRGPVSICDNAGYRAGASLLNVAAREGTVEIAGESCISAYRDGVKDSVAFQVKNPPLRVRDGRCYEAGYFDGILER